MPAAREGFNLLNSGGRYHFRQRKRLRDVPWRYVWKDTVMPLVCKRLGHIEYDAGDPGEKGMDFACRRCGLFTRSTQRPPSDIGAQLVSRPELANQRDEYKELGRSLLALADEWKKARWWQRPIVASEIAETIWKRSADLHSALLYHRMGMEAMNKRREPIIFTTNTKPAFRCEVRSAQDIIVEPVPET